MLWIYLIGCFAIAKASHDNRQKPVLQEILVPRKLVENQTIRLNCDLIQGSKPIRFSWYFNDEPVKESERLQVIVREDDSHLLVKGLSVDSVGRYKCVGANEHGSDQQTVSVYVNSKRTKSEIQILNCHLSNETKMSYFLAAKPVITSDLQSITGLLNQLVILECQTKGFPKAETKWSRVMENG